MAAHGYAAYREAQVTTASGGRLIVMLYDAAVKRLTAALEALEVRDYEGVHNNLIKAQDILTELSDSLDMKFEISRNLFALYEYFIERLVAANVAKDAEPIKEVLAHLTELRDTWEQALQGGARPHSPQAPPAAAGGIEILG